MNEPFTQHDSLQLQRLQQGLGGTNAALDDGEIDEQTHAEVTAALQKRLAPLMQRQQQAKQQADQEQQQALAQQHAQLEAMNQEAAVFRAKGLPARIVKMMEPLTRRPVWLYESSPGKWEEILFQGHQGPEQAPAEGE